MMHVFKPVFRPLVWVLVSLAVFSGCTAKNKSPVPESPGIRLLSLSPAATTILTSLSLHDQLVGIDRWSVFSAQLPEGLPSFDMINPDAERIMALEPDILFVSSMTRDATGTDPFAPFSTSGVTVIYIPVSSTLEDIMNDVRLIARVCGREAAGEAVVQTMMDDIERVSGKTGNIPEQERIPVYMEIGSSPALYSFGRGVYLDELITAAGGNNIFSDRTGWLAVNAEQILEKKPQVILTNVPEAEAVPHMYSRQGWNSLPAVLERRVYAIDHEDSSQPAPPVTRALEEIAVCLYPALFSGDSK